MKKLIVILVLGMGLSALGSNDWSEKTGRFTNCRIGQLHLGLFGGSERPEAIPRMFATARCDEGKQQELTFAFERPMLKDVPSLAALEQILLASKDRGSLVTFDYDGTKPGDQYRVKNFSISFR